MDAELLKCQRTHETLTQRFKLSRRLLHMVSYLNDAGMNDDEFVEYKRRCGDALSMLNNSKRLPKQNIATFGLDSCNLSLYHQCVRNIGNNNEKEDCSSEVKRTSRP